MTRADLPVRECCVWCRRPAARCTASSCDSTSTYGGVFLNRQWVSLDAPSRITQDGAAQSGALEAAVLARRAGNGVPGGPR